MIILGLSQPCEECGGCDGECLDCGAPQWKAQGAAEERAAVVSVVEEELAHQWARKNVYGDASAIALERLLTKLRLRGEHRKEG